MRFLFRLDLSLHADAGKNFEIWNFASKHGPISFLQRLIYLPGPVFAAK